MGLSIFGNPAADTRATFITGIGGTRSSFDGPPADATNGAQTIDSLFDRSGAPVMRIVRGTAGTTNIVVKDQLGADCFIQVQSGTTLTASATVVP